MLPRGPDSTGSFALLDCDPSTGVIMSLYDPHGLPLMVGQTGIQRIGSAIPYMQTKAAEVTYSPLLVRFGEFFYKRPTSIHPLLRLQLYYASDLARTWKKYHMIHCDINPLSLL